MTRSALTAAAASVIATTLATVATATAGTPPASLTHKFPLGSQPLCCQSSTATTSPTSASEQAGTAPGSSRSATQKPAAARSDRDGGAHEVRDWILIALVVVVLLGVCVDRLLARRSSRNYDHRAVRYEYATDDAVPGLPGPGDLPQRAPDPFEPRSGRMGNRGRRGRNDRKSAIPQEREPPPLAIRRRRDR